jgi:hypothetical protein
MDEVTASRLDPLDRAYEDPRDAVGCSALSFPFRT